MIVYENKWFYIEKEGKFHFLVEPKSKISAALLMLCEGKFVLVRQYRTAVHQETLEIPRGYGEIGETSLDCAIREAAEETGINLQPSDVHFLGYMHPNSGINSSKISLFFAKAKSKLDRAFSSSETSETVLVSSDELTEMILDGKIEDSFTLSALTYLHLNPDLMKSDSRSFSVVYHKNGEPDKPFIFVCEAENEAEAKHICENEDQYRVITLVKTGGNVEDAYLAHLLNH